MPVHAPEFLSSLAHPGKNACAASTWYAGPGRDAKGLGSRLRLWGLVRLKFRVNGLGFGIQGIGFRFGV